MSRRRFLAVAGGAGAAGVAAYGRGIEPRAVELTEHAANARTSPAQRGAPDPFGRAGKGDGRGVDLVLSGHMHGGQVRLLGWAPMRPPGSGDYVAGWYRGPGAPPMYVCRGVGTSVLPVRIGARPEVAFFTLWA